MRPGDGPPCTRLPMTRSPLFPALLGLAFVASAFPAQAAIDFDPAVPYALDGKPEGGVLVDLDGDFDLDLAVTTDNPNKIEFFANAGNGTFTAQVPLLLGNATGP